MEAIGDRVARLRKRRGLALRMHRSVSSVSKVERGGGASRTSARSWLSVGLAELRDDIDPGSRGRWRRGFGSRRDAT
jgi:hypothetical protein